MKQNQRPKTPKKMLDYLVGYNSVMEALISNRRILYSLSISRDKKSDRMDKLLQTAEQMNVDIHYENPAKLDSISGMKQHQGIVLKAGSFPYTDLNTILSGSRNPLLLVPDCIEDPRNLGAIIRTAHCVGADGIILPKDRSASPTPLVSKTSAGALEHMNLVQVTNITKTLKALKESGIWIAGLDARGASSLYSQDMTVPLAVVIGGEGKGIRPLVLKNCDFKISIPQKGNIDSLNASVAASVVLYEVLRQRDSLQ